MASSTAPVEPLPLAIKDLHDVEYHDAEKDGGIGHPVTGVNSGPNTIYIDPAAERKLVRKQDLLVLPALGMAYFLCFLDRTNLGNAKVAGLEKSLGLQTYDFNIGACIYYIIYLFADIPGGLAVKKFGFWIVPAATLSFGVVTLATAFIHNRGSFFVMRVLLGFTESFTMPGCAYMLTRYYRRRELTVRIGFFMLSAAATAQAFGGLLASGFLAVPPIGSLEDRWRNIFLCEGIITMGIAASMFYWFPKDPADTKIFNEEERKLSRDRFFADQPAIQEHKEAIETKLIMRALLSPVTLACTWLYICNNITVQGLSIFTVTILRAVYPGRSTVQIQLLAVPPPIVGLAFALTMAYVAMKTGRHAYCIMACLVLAIIGYSLWIVYLDQPKIRYAALFLTQMAGYGYGPIVLSWATANASPDTVRAVTVASVTGFGNIGSIVGTWSYINTDASTGYRIGNALNLSTGSSAFILAALIMLYMLRENKVRAEGKRDHRLNGKDIHLLGSKHPEFRYIY